MAQAISFIYATPQGVRGWDGERLISCEFPLGGRVRGVARALWDRSSELESLLTRAEAADLSAALSDLIPSDRPTGWPNAGSVTLADALRDASEQRVPTELLVVTGDEALWLGEDPRTNRIALRRFVSRLRDSVRRAAYSGVVSRREIEVAGDIPCSSAIDRAFAVVDGALHPLAVSLNSGEIVGSLKVAPGGAVLAEGRLALTAVTSETAWSLNSCATLWHAQGETAQSNLAANDPWKHFDEPLPRVAGIADDRVIARRICLAEGAERFASGNVQREELVWSDASQLQSDWLDPTRVAAYSEDQRSRLGLDEFDHHEPMWWVRGEYVRGPVMIPAALVFYPFLSIPSCIHPSAVSSNGVAAHISYDEASRAAWLELVERDAFQRSRFSGPAHRPDRVDLTQCTDSVIGGLAERSSRLGPIQAFRLASPTEIPVMLARIDTPDQLGLGMSAHPQPLRALQKALAEAYAHASDPFLHEVSLELVDGPGDHAALYRQWPARHAADWMLGGARITIEDVEPGSPEVTVPAHAVTYRYRSSPEDGVMVVRVIDTSLIPLTFGYDSDPLGRHDVQVLLEASGTALDAPLFPHPFA